MKQTAYPRAVARIRGGRDYPTIRGNVWFSQRGDGVLVEAELFGLPRTESGFFAFHIHEGGDCRGMDLLIPAATSTPVAQRIQTMPEICRRCWGTSERPF